ncbi:MAG: hypothetical protein ABI461_12605 [Polyangiaceae bacterium]
MFFAHGSLEIGPAILRSQIGVDHDLRLFAVDRRGVVHDTALLPCVRVPRREVSLFWFVISGRTSWSGPSEGSIEGPAVLTLDESDFDGANGKRTWTFRSSGEPFRGLEVRASRRLVAAELRKQPTPLVCTASTFEAVEAYLSSALDTNAAGSAVDVLALLDALAPEKIFEPSLKKGISVDEDPRLVALWQELASAYARADTRPSLKRIAEATAMSLRNISRFMTLASRELLLPPGGWRDTTVNLRLTMAMLFLSCPMISIADVARAMGYGHSEAMANAFQRAGLLSPSDARSAVKP